MYCNTHDVCCYYETKGQSLQHAGPCTGGSASCDLSADAALSMRIHALAVASDHYEMLAATAEIDIQAPTSHSRIGCYCGCCQQPLAPAH
jgi:hypothetical protein